jgi:hypothetical protein
MGQKSKPWLAGDGNLGFSQVGLSLRGGIRRCLI